jgi:hypothetical protein
MKYTLALLMFITFGALSSVSFAGSDTGHARSSVTGTETGHGRGGGNIGG